MHIAGGFADLNGSNPNGTWSLYVSDAFPADDGEVSDLDILKHGAECSHVRWRAPASRAPRPGRPDGDVP